MDALRNAAGDRQIDLAQPQHLQALDEARIPRGTGGPDRQCGPVMPRFSEISPAGLLATVRGLWWCDQTLVS